MADLSLIGLGSSNMLNQDLINTLKEAQSIATVSPIEYQQEVNLQKKEAVLTIDQKVRDLHTWVNQLTDPTQYENKEVYTTNQNVIFTITDSTQIDQIDYSMDITQMANRDVYQTEIINNLEEPFLTADNSFDLTINGETTTITMSDTETYVDLLEKINNIDGIEGEFVKVNAEGDFRLKIRSLETGTNNSITFSNIDTEIDNILGLSTTDNHILTAQNMKLTLDGIEVERESNEVSDLIPGMNFSIYETGTLEIKVKHDITGPVEAYNNFILEYNALMDTVQGYKENLEEGARSVLLGINEVTQGLRNIKSALFSFNETVGIGEEGIKSIFQAGFDLSETGELKANSIKREYEIPDGFGGTKTHIQEFSFEEMMGSEPELFKGFFTGDNTPLKDVLSELNKIVNIDGLTDENGNTKIGSFESLVTSYEEQDKAYTERIDYLKEKLDIEYEQMQTRFAMFDTIINNMNNSFSSLQMIIDQSTASN